ncbi:hypothetical protein [Celeribacter sp. HF31]|nr:hypothetical protein [Celeribacter sp. HF31]
MSKFKSLFSGKKRSTPSFVEREKRQSRELRYDLNYQMNRRISL